MERASGIAYWSGAVVLVVLGSLSLFSIGAPLALTGFAMIVVGRSRHRREVLWPALVAVWSFVIAYVLVAPLGCASTSVPFVGTHDIAAQVGRTTCTNVLGINYSGGGGYQPTLLPALVVGLIAAGVVGLVMRRAFSRRAPAVRT